VVQNLRKILLTWSIILSILFPLSSYACNLHTYDIIKKYKIPLVATASLLGLTTVTGFAFEYGWTRESAACTADQTLVCMNEFEATQPNTCTDNYKNCCVSFQGSFAQCIGSNPNESADPSIPITQNIAIKVLSVANAALLFYGSYWTVWQYIRTHRGENQNPWDDCPLRCGGI